VAEARKEMIDDAHGIDKSIRRNGFLFAFGRGHSEEFVMAFSRCRVLEIRDYFELLN
jgi:DNA transposition AAA+ family ATPase